MTSSAPDGVDLTGVRTVLCDLDGVVWLAHEPIPGSVEAIADLRRTGRRVLFVTNNSRATMAEQEAALAAIGIPAAGDVVSSAAAAAHLLRPGMRVLLAGGPGVEEAIAAVGAEPIPNDGTATAPFDAVVAGLHRDFDYQRMASACRAIRAGARFIATNEDATYPTPTGEDPGGGAIVAAIATGAVSEPEVAGKPHEPMASVIRSIIAPDGGFDPASVIMVGDRAETDGLFAKTLGCHYAQVRTGVVPPGEPLRTELPVSLDVQDLATVGRAIIGETSLGAR